MSVRLVERHAGGHPETATSLVVQGSRMRLPAEPGRYLAQDNN